MPLQRQAASKSQKHKIALQIPLKESITLQKIDQSTLQRSQNTRFEQTPPN
jgi:hypothetical protein